MSSPPTDDLRLRFRGAVRHQAGPQQLAQAGFRSRGLPTPRLRLLSALRFGGPRRLRDLSGELGVITRTSPAWSTPCSVTAWSSACPSPAIGGPPWSGSPRAGERLAGELLAAQRVALAELLAELLEADQPNLLQALESLRAVLARHPER